MEECVLENAYTLRARFSKNNINILNVSEVGDFYVVQYEFQWRSPSTVTYRWHKTFTALPKDIVDEDEHTMYYQFAKAILGEVQNVRDVLENGEDR